MEKRIGVIGIIIEEFDKATFVNDILHEFGNLIVGRIGVPYKDRGIFVISIIVDGTMDEISAMTGRIGKISGVNVKSAINRTLGG
ncbi:TM1266 family iron-only hydrogenase system putative regulator [Clostridium sp.]|uniref:TM1266 family iron-only hydrogenase system putative regulator n=1 Tax=Clostridium sp. TaxID=1506 RepID=UPI003F4B33B8